MSYLLNCSCPACRVRALCWPVLLLTAGVLFSLDVIWNMYPIWKTWPLILIVWGLCSLAYRLAPDTNHGMPPAPPTGGASNAS